MDNIFKHNFNKDLLNNSIMDFIMSSKFTKKQEINLKKKIKKLIYMRNINRIFNKKS